MTSIKESIFIFDLHNTLYDEVVEFASAMTAGIAVVVEAALVAGISIESAAVASELATAHARCSSDWDPAVWLALPCVQQLANAEQVAAQAQAARQRVSERETRRTAYTDSLDAIRSLKAQGALVYLATEATANAAADSVRWLDLDGVLDGVYSWPYDRPFNALAKTKQIDFPSLNGVALQKPHAFIVARILLDLAISRKNLPAHLALEDVFDLSVDSSVNTSTLQRIAGDRQQEAVFLNTIEAVSSRLVIRQGPHAECLHALLDQTIFVGDSYFKDGVLALNAGVAFVHAAYGKQVAPEEESFVKECQEMLYSVTGWEPLLLQCTHEAGRIPELVDRIEPTFICKESFLEYFSFRK